MFLDGVYAGDDYGQQRFRRVKAPTHDELNTLVHTLSHRIARCLEKRGVLERDAENSWLTLEEEEGDVLTQLQGASVHMVFIGCLFASLNKSGSVWCVSTSKIGA